MNASREIRDIQFVPRWTIIRTIRQQTVAEHSFFVVMYSDYIADLVGYLHDRAELLRYAMWHDMTEIITGDLPSPASKWFRQEELNNWAEDEFQRSTGLRFQRPSGLVKDIIKTADTLDATLFLAEEVQMGNRAVFDLFSHLKEDLEEAIKSGLRHPEIWSNIVSMVHKAEVGQSRICGT